MIKNISGLHVKSPLFLSAFYETLIFWKFLKKYPHYKFHENPSSGSWVIAHGWTNRRDDANSHFSQFCEHT